MRDEATSFLFNISWFIICCSLPRLGSWHNQKTPLCVLRCKLRAKRRPRALAKLGVLTDTGGMGAGPCPAGVRSGGEVHAGLEETHRLPPNTSPAAQVHKPGSLMAGTEWRWGWNPTGWQLGHLACWPFPGPRCGLNLQAEPEAVWRQASLSGLAVNPRPREPGAMLHDMPTCTKSFTRHHKCKGKHVNKITQLNCFQAWVTKLTPHTGFLSKPLVKLSISSSTNRKPPQSVHCRLCWERDIWFRLPDVTLAPEIHHLSLSPVSLVSELTCSFLWCCFPLCHQQWLPAAAG